MLRHVNIHTERKKSGAFTKNPKLSDPLTFWVSEDTSCTNALAR